MNGQGGGHTGSMSRQDKYIKHIFMQTNTCGFQFNELGYNVEIDSGIRSALDSLFLKVIFVFSISGLFCFVFTFYEYKIKAMFGRCLSHTNTE